MDNSFLNRKENLILTAIEVIDELGIQGLSTREVAKRQDMSNAVLFNHFHSKNELILSVLQYYTQYDSAMVQTIKSQKMEANEAIVFMIETLVTYYENYPAITAIIQATDGLLANAELSNDVKDILDKREIFVRQLIEDAQAKGQISSDVNSELISDIIFGSLKTICLKWRIEGYSFSLKERAVKTINTILEKFSASS